MSEGLDVLLVNPGTELEGRGNWKREPPAGLLYIAAVLEQDGFTCQFVEPASESFQPSEILQKVPVPAMIGFTALTNTCNQAFSLAEQFREAYIAMGEHPAFVIGGPHATFSVESMLLDSPFDFCFIGEAEPTISQFVNLTTIHRGKIQELKHELKSKWMREINVAFMDGGKIQEGHGKHEGNLNIDILPLPARYLLPINNQDVKFTTATVIANRGCPNRCIFCSRQALFKKARWRGVESIIKEIEEIHELGIYSYYNMYDNLTVSRQFMKRFLAALIARQDLSLPWGAELRVDMIDSEGATLLSKAGCRLIATGIESASNEILKTACKIQSIEAVTAGLKRVKQVGIPVQAYFVLGLPGETKETFRETLAYIQECPLEPGVDKVDIFAATPYPGSGLSERSKELGIHIFNHDLNTWDCQHPVFETRDLDKGDIEQLWSVAKAFEEAFNSARLHEWKPSL